MEAPPPAEAAPAPTDAPVQVSYLAAFMELCEIMNALQFRICFYTSVDTAKIAKSSA